MANITGVILAGGKNSRMGSDKGMLLVKGKKIVERTIDVVNEFVNDIIIISNGKNYDHLGYPVINDIIKDCGPMGGIYTALRFSKTDKILVISCDMPFVSGKVLLELARHTGDEEIIIPEHRDRDLEPLCAIYSVSCLNKFDELLRSGEWKLKESLKYFKVHKVTFQDHEISENCFMNVNTPAEYQSVIRSTHEYSN